MKEMREKVRKHELADKKLQEYFDAHPNPSFKISAYLTQLDDQYLTSLNSKFRQFCSFYTDECKDGVNNFQKLIDSGIKVTTVNVDKNMTYQTVLDRCKTMFHRFFQFINSATEFIILSF